MLLIVYIDNLKHLIITNIVIYMSIKKVKGTYNYIFVIVLTTIFIYNAMLRFRYKCFIKMMSAVPIPSLPGEVVPRLPR